MNRVEAKIVGVECEGGVALVDMASASGLALTCLLLETPESRPELRPGHSVVAVFKETEVALAKGLQGAISIRNRLPGRVVKLELGRMLAAVWIDCRGERIQSVITRRSAERMALAVGDEVEGLVKANEVAILWK